MTTYSNNTAKSVKDKGPSELSFLLFFTNDILLFHSSSHSIFLLSALPHSFAINFLLSYAFLRLLFILSIMSSSSLRSHSFYANSFLLYFTIYFLNGCLSLFLASLPPSHSSLRCLFDRLLYFVFVSLHFLHYITIPLFLSFLPLFFYLLSLSFLYLLCLYSSLSFLAFL
jgi:hypothetical protein